MQTEAWTLRNDGFILYDGLTVANPAIQQHELEESIEPWMSRYPLASYDKTRADSITPPDLLGATKRILAIQAQKGMGKSKAIREAVRKLPDDATILVITFRRSLAWSSAHLLGRDSSIYQEELQSSLYETAQPVLTVVINSLARCKGEWDYVIIDEVVSVVDAICSSTIDPARRISILSTLGRLLDAAKRIVIADAALEPATTDFILCSAGMRYTLGSELSVTDYTHRNHSDYVFRPMHTLDAWLDVLDGEVASGRNVVIPCMTKNMALSLSRRFKDSGYVTQCYVAGMDPNILSTHMGNVHEHWTRVQVLIFSPVITAGVSYELDHFDTCFLYAMPGLGTPRSAMQMVSRVRNYRSKRVYVYIHRCPRYDTPLEPIPSDPEPVENDGDDATSTTPRSIVNQSLDIIDWIAERDEVRARRAFAYDLFAMVVFTGASIRFDARINIIPADIMERANANIQASRALTDASKRPPEQFGRDSLTRASMSLNHRQLEFEGSVPTGVISATTMRAMPSLPEWVGPETSRVWSKYLLRCVARLITNIWATDIEAGSNPLTSRGSVLPGRRIHWPVLDLHMATCSRDEDVLRPVARYRRAIHERVHSTDVDTAHDPIAKLACWVDANITGAIDATSLANIGTEPPDCGGMDKAIYDILINLFPRNSGWVALLPQASSSGLSGAIDFIYGNGSSVVLCMIDTGILNVPTSVQLLNLMSYAALYRARAGLTPQMMVLIKGGRAICIDSFEAEKLDQLWTRLASQHAVLTGTWRPSVCSFSIQSMGDMVRQIEFSDGETIAERAPRAGLIPDQLRRAVTKLFDAQAAQQHLVAWSIKSGLRALYQNLSHTRDEAMRSRFIQLVRQIVDLAPYDGADQVNYWLPGDKRDTGPELSDLAGLYSRVLDYGLMVDGSADWPMGIMYDPPQRLGEILPGAELISWLVN